MPRNITVTFADGTNHVYKNAPDNITPGQVSARAIKEFGRPIKSLDGGRNPEAVKPAGPSQATALQKYQQARSIVVKNTAGRTAQEKQRALARFDSDPRVQPLRQMAGMPKLSTREQEIKAAGRRAAAKGPRTYGAALQAGISRSLLGIPERIAAAGLYYGGNAGDLNYDETLSAVRAKTDAQMEMAPTTAFAGQVGGSIAGGGFVGSAIKRGATRLAAAATPTVAKTGNVLSKLLTFEKGQKLANVGKVAVAGTLGGGAQAAGEGSDITTGALTGAVAAPVVGGVIKAARFVGGKLLRQATRPFSTSNSKAIRELAKEAPDAIAARHAALSAQVGENVPVVAALNDGDFRAVSKRVIQHSPEAEQVAKAHTGGYIRKFMDRMLSHVNNAGRTGDAQITSIGELAQLRRDTADDLMSPIRDRMMDITQIPLDDVEKSVTKEIGSRIKGLAPRMKEAFDNLDPGELGKMGLDASDLAAARRLMTDWGLGNPVEASVKEMDSLRRALEAAGKSSATSNPANAMAYRNAAKSVRDFVQSNVPEYGQVIDTFAAQSRMMEGFEHAASGKRVMDTPDDQLRKNLQTPEGRVGMKAGELFRQREAVTARPTSAMAAARDFAAEGKLTRPASMDPGAAPPGTITENLGEAPAAQLANASQGETKVLGRMVDTEKVSAMARDEGGVVSPEELAYGAFIGGSMPGTKARFLARLLDHLPQGFNKKVANNLADMLYSGDRAQSAKAITALKKIGIREGIADNVMYRPGAGIASGALAASQGVADIGAPTTGDAQSVEGDLGEVQDPAMDPNVDPGVEGSSPYAAELDTLYQNEDPELLDLIERVSQQESGGNQMREDGSPVTSSAGAIGIMQVMPDTAPEAAKLAGLPWDEAAYRGDEAYNKLLGIAYLSELLRRYDGDVDKALAAYNAGPGRLESAMADRGDGWLSGMSAETQDYVARIS